MRRCAKRLFVLGMSTALCGCGYHVVGHTNALPKNIHVIAVPALENKTTTYRIEQKLTAATIHEFLAKTTFHVGSDPNAGDAVLRGKVISMEVTPLVFQTETTPATGTTPATSVAQATVMLVTMKCEVTLTDRATEKVLYHTDNFIFRNEYQLATSLSPANVESFFQEGDPALDRMSQDFAQRLVAAVTENY